MSTILDTIIAHKKKEVASCKELIPVNELKKMPLYKVPAVGFRESILHPERTGIIAEFKRQSPSKGVINASVRVEEVTTAYARYGASALSVLTDFNFFGGSLDDLQKARAANTIPILRKEFMVDAYQVHEAKAMGADAILLIAACLEKEEAMELAKTAKDLGLQVLMELHADEELDILNDYLDVVGVNNRNLKTFEVDLQHSVELAKKIPDRFVKISESGISSVENIQFLRKHGFRGFLIGENFMKTADPGEAFSHFVDELKQGVA